MNTLRAITLLYGLSLTLSVSAAEDVYQPHSGIASLPSLDSFIGQTSARDYGLQFTPAFSVDVKLNGQQPPAPAFVIQDRNYWQEYNVESFFIQLNASVAITQKNEVYAAFGTNETDLLSEYHDTTFSGDDSASWGGALGWRYRFTPNWSTNLDYQHVERSDVDVSTVNFGVIYSF
ncbi:outer membrane beta-barrel protein [Aestuariibacter salexigens]|uniref:outer membrane beta-barrel protein n=1 Tax=Aestuariibacter salexigens TaxID=226010 RepID=UPI00041EE701|nr:outer membrane beta-barrel protein [Aestuariibacter salexigens]